MGTTSTTVIQSMPSMKLTRFTNQSIARNIRARSTHQGRIEKICKSGGSIATTTSTAMACNSSRGKASSGRMSSVTPTKASAITLANTTASRNGSPKEAGVNTAAAAIAIVVAAITAMPPPCGVGWRCEERALGLAKA